MKLVKTTVVDELRDLLNWVAIFEEEYDLPTEVVKELKSRIERVSQALQELETHGARSQPSKRKSTKKQTNKLHEEAKEREENYWAELEDEDTWMGLEEELEDDEIRAGEAAFVKGYTAERRGAAEKG